MTATQTALERIRETLRRAREAAPEGPGLMPQSRVPQTKPPPKPWNEVDRDEPEPPEAA